MTPVASTTVAVPPAPVQRHEVEPTVPYAIVPGPARDTFLFYHIDATAKDVNGLWDYCRFCVSNLVWVNDHFVVTPNPLYLVASSDLEERHAKIKRVLLNWYRAKRLVGDLKLSFD
ncbi:MAG TPA: hypothetical protein VHS99_01645 [Chloroflexota bacterium]|nr:hypothetical protein [Chloroflexota bacterium]